MKRHQIRRMIPVNISDAQLRREIADLQLPVDDNYDYTTEQSKAIIDHFKGQGIHKNQEEYTRDRLSQSQTSAQRIAEQTKLSLVTSHQNRLVALNDALDKAEQRRDEVLERLSDRIVYLQDDSLFMNDLLKLAQTKLRNGQEPEKEDVTTTAIDALVTAFDVIGDWELPAIAPSSALGCLPM